MIGKEEKSTREGKGDDDSLLRDAMRLDSG